MRHRLSVLALLLTTACADLQDFDAKEPVCFQVDVVSTELTQGDALVDRNSILSTLGDRSATSGDVTAYWLYGVAGLGMIAGGAAVAGVVVAGGAALSQASPPLIGAATAAVVGGLYAVKKSDEHLVSALATHNRRVGGCHP